MKQATIITVLSTYLKEVIPYLAEVINDPVDHLLQAHTSPLLGLACRLHKKDGVEQLLGAVQVGNERVGAVSLVPQQLATIDWLVVWADPDGILAQQLAQ